MKTVIVKRNDIEFGHHGKFKVPDMETLQVSV